MATIAEANVAATQLMPPELPASVVADDNGERLAELERRIEGGFQAIGESLREIRDDRLYLLSGHETFEAYVYERFKMSRPHSYRLIQASHYWRVVVSPIGDKGWTEGSVRELCRLETLYKEMLGFDESEAKVRALETAKRISERISADVDAGKVTLTAKTVRQYVNDEMGWKPNHFHYRPEDWPQPQRDLEHEVLYDVDGELQEKLQLLDEFDKPMLQQWQQDNALTIERVCGRIEQFKAALGVGDERAALPEPKTKPHVANATGFYEWYTPKVYADAARKVMGAIDLDPASSDVANTVIEAADYFTIEQDGLAQAWRGRVWMNPPFASGHIERFIDKLAESIDSGAVTEAIVLANNGTETKWFRTLFRIGAAVCFPEGLVKFWCPDDSQAASSPPQGQAIVYCGRTPKKFKQHFGKFGAVLLTSD